MPTLSIEGNVPGLPMILEATGDMAENFSEGYSVEIQAKDRAAGDQTGQSPHPPDLNFDKGQFDNTRFSVTLFSGCVVNRREIFSGKDLLGIAESLYRISMPRPLGSSFIGPPLVTVNYGTFWRATGLFQKVTCNVKGGWDSTGHPTILTLEMEFVRHFGGESGAGGVYKSATKEQLKKATAVAFAFRG